MTRDVHQELIDKFKDEPFSIIDKQGTILNKTHLSSMGYATHVPYSVVGLDDLLTSINKLAHEKEELEKENEQLKKDRFICLDCEYSGYTEIGCLCEKQDHWVEFTKECEDFEKFKDYLSLGIKGEIND